jgi:uncharacterized membrane protein
MEAIAKAVGLLIFSVIAIGLIVFFAGFILAAFGVFIGIFLAAWACGLPITISKNGKKIGYYRWTTFHPYR